MGPDTPRAARRALAVTLSLLAAAPLLACKRRSAPAPAARPTPLPSLSSGVAAYASAGRKLLLFDLDPARPRLAMRAEWPLPYEVQYAAVHPSRRFLYVSTSESRSPPGREQRSALVAFAIDRRSGALSPLGAPVAPRLGRAIHLTVDGTGGFLLLAHGAARTVSVHRLLPDGRLGPEIEQPRAIGDTGFLTHQVRVDPSNRHVLVPARGREPREAKRDGGVIVQPEERGRLTLFELDEGVLTQRKVIEYPSGLGPRHLDFHPTLPLVYVSLERGNRLLAYRLEDGALTEKADLGTLEDPNHVYPAQRAGAVHVHPSGRFVYVSNRNAVVEPEPLADGGLARVWKAGGENSIAAFSLDPETGLPRLLQRIESRGVEPRTFDLDPAGRTIVAANQRRVLRRDAGGGLAAVLPSLALFRVEADGRLAFVRAHDVDGPDVAWMGVIGLDPARADAGGIDL